MGDADSAEDSPKIPVGTKGTILNVDDDIGNVLMAFHHLPQNLWIDKFDTWNMKLIHRPIPGLHVHTTNDIVVSEEHLDITVVKGTRGDIVDVGEGGARIDFVGHSD